MQNSPIRYSYITKLVQHFHSEYDDMIEHYNPAQRIELTEHLIFMLEQIAAYSRSKKEEDYTQFSEREMSLLKRYGKLFKPYADKGFYKYFYIETLLAEKGIITTEIYNDLPAEQQSLTNEEVSQFSQLCSKSLRNALFYFYLDLEPEDSILEGPPAPAINETDKEITKARQLLAIYFLLKAGWGIEHRSSNSVSQIAKFVHLMTGTKFTSIQNSEIYKKYLQMPNFNKDIQLLKDLKFIRSYFEDLDIIKAVELIDAEIQATTKQLPVALRKKLDQEDE